jgi:hypothetical protein
MSCCRMRAKNGKRFCSPFDRLRAGSTLNIDRRAANGLYIERWVYLKGFKPLGNCLNSSGKYLNSSGRCLNSSGKWLNSSGRRLGNFGRRLGSSGRRLGSLGRRLWSSGRRLISSGKASR